MDIIWMNHPKQFLIQLQLLRERGQKFPGLINLNSFNLTFGEFDSILSKRFWRFYGHLFYSTAIPVQALFFEFMSGDYHRLSYVLIQNMVFPAFIFLFIHSNMSRIFFFWWLGLFYIANNISRQNPANIYLFRFNNRNTRKGSEISSKLTIKTPERRQWRSFGVFIVSFEHISHSFLVFLLGILSK